MQTPGSEVDVLQLATSYVLTEKEDRVLVGQLWTHQPAILVFLRHFACIACRAHAADVWKNRERFQKTGARIVFIGNGQANFIEGFKKDVGIEQATVFTDPTLQTFKACGFKRGFLRALGPRSIMNGLKLKADGHSNSKYEDGAGDLWQLGGVVAVKPGNVVTYHYMSEALGDFPPEKDTALVA